MSPHGCGARREDDGELTPRDSDRLTVFLVAGPARERRARGVLLGHPEAVALICDEVHEAVRDGLSHDEVMSADGTKLGTVRDPIR